MNLIKAITFLLCSTLLVGQTTPIRNPQIQGASGAIISGATLTNSGTFVNSGTINGAGTFNFGSGTVTLPASSVTSGNITDGAVVNADINASAAIDISKLASSAITIAGTSTSLGGSITASAILDSISSTQGTILYRGASGWSALSPGTSGHFLKTQGAGANPMWDAVAGSGSVATDAIWDAAGDLAVGTGANTAARLAIGTSGYVLTSNGTTATWSAPTGGAFSALSDVDLTGIASGDMLKWSGTDWINRTAANVRTDLGLVIGTNVQAYDADLTTYAGITPSANVQSLLGAADYSAMRTQLGLGAAALLGTSSGGNGTADNGKVLIFDTGGHFHATTSISVNNTSATIVCQLRPDTLLLNSTGSGSHTIGGAATGARVHSLLDADGTLAHTSTTLSGYGITDGQPLDATLTALAALNNTRGTLAQTGGDTFTRLQTPVNVKFYGAAGDARKVTDAVLNGTTTVTSATAAFTSADTGKVVWGVETSSGAARLPVGTATYVNSTTITCSVAATGSYTGISLVIGTDDTAEIQAAAAAADAMSPKGQVYIPSGGYVFSDRLFNQSYASSVEAYSIVGDGSSSSKLFASPSHSLTGGAVFNSEGNTQMGVVRGLQLDGSSYEFAGSPAVASAGGYAIWDDVKIVNFKGVVNLLNIQTAGGRFYNCHFENSSYVGILVAGGADFYGCYTGNHGYIGLHVSSGGVIWTGGFVDECSGPSIYLATSTLKISNATVYAGGSQNACETTGSCSIYAVNSQFVPYGANNNCTGILLASSGTARLVNCTLTGSGTGYGLNNSGTVYDVGGNTFTTTTGTSPVDALNSIVSVVHGGTGASSLNNLITLGTMTTGNYVADVAGTSNEITSTHTPGEGSTATLSLPATIDLGGKTSFEIPNGAAPTVDAFGEIAGDNDLWAASRGAPVFFDGTASTALVNVLVSDAPSNGQVPKWNTGGTITWEADNSGGTISGTDTQVMFFDGTDTPAGDAGMTYNKTTNVLTATGFVGALTGNASTVTTNANMTGDVTSSGSNATTLAAISGSGPLLAENASIRLDPAGSADGKYSGTTVTGTAGATLAFGDVVVLDVTDSRWELADANSAAAADGDARAMLGICVLAAASDGSATTILLHGIVRADTAFPTFTIGAPVYVSETAGDATSTQPTTADVLIRVIGHALTADEMFFNPDNSWITHL